MLEDHPILKDRLIATAVFSGIAVALVSGVNMIIGGGFDFITPGRDVTPRASFVRVLQTTWLPRADVTPTSNSPGAPMMDADAGTTENLVGAGDDTSTPDTYDAGPNTTELYRQVDELSAQDSASAADVSYDDSASEEGYVDDKSKDDVSASETASPW